MVAHEPGSWFDEVLASLRAQDYPRHHITVLAAGEGEAVARQVTAGLPAATVRQVDAHQGYGRTANTVLGMESPPAFYLFCHDDVALAPDALRLLVEEALRSNASIVGPKLVRWDRPEELLDVGLDLDKLGYVAPRVEPGELDQEQHDSVSDVLAVSGAVQLVRADLFHALDGFDASMGLTGEDIDFCWRAHVAGARILAVPSAVARHRAGIGDRLSSAERDRLRERHRIRTILSVYGVAHSVRVLPQAAVYSILRAIGALLSGHLATARSALGAWVWNLVRPASLVRRRLLLRKTRKVPDSEIRNLQVRGFAPVSQFLRGTLAGEGGGSIAARSRNIVRALRSGPSRLSLAFWALTITMFVFGSRHLITRQVPVVGDLVPFDLGGAELIDRWFESWRSTGTGREAAAPTAFGLIAVLAVPFLGFMGLLRMVLTLGMLPIGAIGLWRLLRPFSSPWIRVVGTLMYVTSPLPYNALVSGSWGALVTFGLLPWVLAGIARAGRLAPFGRLGGAVGEGVLEPAWIREILALGVVIGALVAFEPFAAAIVVGLVGAVMIGSLFAGWPGGGPRMVAITFGGLVVAAVLNLPWILDAVSTDLSWDWFGGTRPSSPETPDLSALLRLDTGRLGGAPLGWALPIAGLVPLALARGPRWAWAVRGLCLYLAAVASVWATGQGWVPLSIPRPEILLVAGALGLSVSAAMGVAAIERDLRTFKFGWRQFMPITAVAAVALAVLPVTAAAFNGAWHMPGTDFNRQFAQQATPELPQRVLWIGHDDVLAVGGQGFLDDLTVSVSAGLTTGFADRWAATPEPAQPLLLEALELAIDGGTSRLGRLLAPFGIGEIIVLDQSAPAPAIGLSQPVPDGLRAALTEQLDLAEFEVGPGVTRYQNTAVLPVAALVPSGTTSGVSLRVFAGRGADAAGSSLLPTDASRTTFTGVVSADQEVYAAVPAETSWRLTVEGQTASVSPALDWALAYQPTVSGNAVLTHRSTTRHRLLMGGQGLLWALAIVALLRVTSKSRAHQR